MKLRHFLIFFPFSLFLLLNPYLTDYYNYYFDKYPPMIIVSTPSGKVGGIIEINLSVWDACEPLDLKVSLGTMNLQAKPDLDFSLKIDTKNLSDGEHLFKVEVKDSSKRQNFSFYESILLIDNTPPKVELTWDKQVLESGGLIIGKMSVEDDLTFLKLTYEGEEIPYAPKLNPDFSFDLKPKQINFVIGFSATEKGGNKTLLIESQDDIGNRSLHEVDLKVVFKKFPSEQITIPTDRLNLLDAELLRQERLLVSSVLEKESLESFWDGNFIKPVDGVISSDYGTLRVYNQGLMYDRHGGLDFKAARGTPVSAANSGIVVLAKPLKARGNTVIIDHGLGFMSLYYHLEEIRVKEGELVKKGEIIGTVGNTGISTGPHLHFEIKIRGISIDPKHLF